MNTTAAEQLQELRISRSYTFPVALHEDLRRRSKLRAEGNKSAMAEHFINVGMVADSEKTLPAPLVEAISELASRQGLPFLKMVESALAAGLPLLREQSAGISASR